MNKKTDTAIIGWCESLGFPFAWNGKSRRCLQDYILEEIEEAFTKKQLSFPYLNFFSMFFNKTWHLQGILTHNLTINDILQLKELGNETARNDFFTKLGMPKELGFQKIYNKEQKIQQLIQTSHRPLILYDAGINDFMYHFHNNFFVATIQAKHTKYTIWEMEQNHYLDQVIEHISNNIQMILSLNPEAKIYLLGFSLLLYTPKLPYAFYKKLKAFQKVDAFLQRFQQRLIELEQIFPICYLDTTHFSTANEAISSLTMKILKDYEKETKINNVPFSSSFDQKGILGMIEDANDKIKQYQDRSKLPFSHPYEQKKNKALISKHETELEIYKKLLQSKIH